MVAGTRFGSEAIIISDVVGLQTTLDGKATLPITLPSGTKQAINLDSTTSSATVPNVDTNVKTYALGNNTFSLILIESDVELVNGVLSSIQDITLKAKIGATTKSFIIPAVNVAGRKNAHLALQVIQQAATTIAISHGSILADVNSTVNVLNLYVWGIV